MQFRRRSQPGTRTQDLRHQKPAVGRRWRRFFFRTSVRIIVALFLLLVGLAMVVWFGTWSLPWLDRKIQVAWVGATGLPLSYAEATFQPSDGRVVFKQPVISDPDSGEMLIELDQMTLSISFLDALLNGKPLLVRDLSLEGRVRLDLAIAHGQLVVEGPWQRIIDRVTERVKQARLPDGTHGPLPIIFNQMHLSRGDLTLYEVKDQFRQSLVSMTQTTFDVTFGESIEPRQILIDGRLNEKDLKRPLMISISPDFARRRAHLSLRLNDFSSRRDLPFDLPFTAKANTLELQGLVALSEDGVIHSSGGSTIDNVNLTASELPLSRALGEVGFRWDVDYQLSNRHLNVKSMNLSSRHGRIQSRGSMEFQSPFAYDLAIEPLEITPEGVALAETFLPREIKILNANDARLVLEGGLQGRGTEPYPNAVQCRLKIAGLDVQAPALPAPLRKIALEARLTTGSLVLERASGILQGIPVEIQGRMDGNIFARQIDKVEMQWVTVGDIKGFTPLLDQQVGEGFEVAGDVSGEGRLVAVGPFRSGLFNALTQVRMDGELRFNGGRVSHPLLRDPIEGLSGRIKIEPTEASFNGLMGQFGDVKFDLDGKIAGSPRFWDHPSYDINGRLSFELEELVTWAKTYANGRGKDLEGLPSLQGHGDLAFSAGGLASAWDMTELQGTLALENLQTELSGPIASGPVNISQAVVSFDRANIRLEKLEGVWGDLTVIAKGTFSPAGGDVALTLDGALQAYKTQIPPLLKDFRVDGHSRIEHKMTLKAGGEATAHDWFEMLLDQRFRPSEGEAMADWFMRSWTMDHHGEIVISDGELTFRTMPTRLRHIHGHALYDQERLWMPAPASVEGGEGARDLVGAVELIYGRGKPLLFSFNVSGGHFPLQQWLGPWRDNAHAETTPSDPDPSATPETAPPTITPRRGADFDPTLTPDFKILGSIHSQTFDMLGLQGEAFEAGLTVEVSGAQSRHVRWHDMKANLYGGRATIEGDLFEDGMKTDIHFDKVALPPMMAALTGKESGQGLFSGDLTGQLLIEKELGRSDAPFHGHGQIEITGSRFVANSVLKDLGGVLKLPFFEDISFSKIEGPIVFEGPVISTEGLVFNSPVMDLKAIGKAGPEKRLDFKLQVEFLRLVDSVPLVGSAMNLFNRLAGKLLSFQVGGTFDEPRISVL